MKMKVRSQNVKVRFQVVMWLAASESEVQVVRSQKVRVGLQVVRLVAESESEAAGSDVGG